jgi:hypothetical protein
MADKIKITILEDGTIKTDTDAVSMPNHSNAEKFLLQVAALAGGDVERRSKAGHAEHSHNHGKTWRAHN